jgi:hypothetical protein
MKAFAKDDNSIIAIYSQAGLIPRPSGRQKILICEWFVMVLNPHKIHSYQNQHTSPFRARLLIGLISLLLIIGIIVIGCNGGGSPTSAVKKFHTGY